MSRAALAAYAVGAALVLAMAWLKRPSARTLAATLMGVAGAALVAAFAMDALKHRLEEVKLGLEKSEVELRDVLNEQSRAMRDDNPLLGLGWNNFGIANSRPQGADYSGILEDWDASRGFRIVEENYLANPLTESLYWLLMAENGWTGWALFLLFQGITLVTALRAWRRDPGGLAGYAAFAILTALTLCYLHGNVERILTQVKNLSHWLLLAGLAAGMARRGARLSNGRPENAADTLQQR